MDNSLIIILIAVITLMFIANSSLGKAESPKAIKNLKSSQLWKITFFDNNKWLKSIIIIIIKFGSWLIFGLWRLISTGIRLGTPSFFKKIQKGF